MKKYSNAEMQIVRMSNIDIVTESFAGNRTYGTGEGINLAAPGQRGLDDYYEGY